MTCEVYREQFNRALDGGTQEHPSEEMIQHAHTCTGCREYTSSMLALHTGLSSLPMEQPSRKLLLEISSIGRVEDTAGRTLDWKPEIRRAFVFILPLLLIVILRWFRADWAGPVEYFLVTAALAWLFTNILRPFFFVQSGARSKNL